MKEMKTLTQVMERAICCNNPIKVKYPCGTIGIFYPEIDVDDGCYEVNNSVISFIENNNLYVIPYFRSVIDILRNSGFVQRTIYVPFSNGDYPIDMENKWNDLQADALMQRYVDFVSDCEKHADQCGFGAIPTELFEKCFEMPISGIKVKHPNYEATYYPEISSYCFDCTAADSIGHYNINNGVCVFVYRNGKTYVTKNWLVVRTLRENGYKEKGFAVPFSNLETIEDPYYAQKWEVITA